MTENICSVQKIISRKEWKKQYKNCDQKILYPRCGDGGSDPRCNLLAGIRWGRCWYSKCPKIRDPDFAENGNSTKGEE